MTWSPDFKVDRREKGILGGNYFVPLALTKKQTSMGQFRKSHAQKFVCQKILYCQKVTKVEKNIISSVWTWNLDIPSILLSQMIDFDTFLWILSLQNLLWSLLTIYFFTITTQKGTILFGLHTRRCVPQHLSLPCSAQLGLKRSKKMGKEPKRPICGRTSHN
jgi:hypothetical protein